MRKIKLIIGILICTIFAVFILGGCKDNNAKGNDANAAAKVVVKSKYMECDIDELSADLRKNDPAINARYLDHYVSVIGMKLDGSSGMVVDSRDGNLRLFCDTWYRDKDHKGRLKNIDKETLKRLEEQKKKIRQRTLVNVKGKITKIEPYFSSDMCAYLTPDAYILVDNNNLAAWQNGQKIAFPKDPNENIVQSDKTSESTKDNKSKNSKNDLAGIEVRMMGIMLAVTLIFLILMGYMTYIIAKAKGLESPKMMGIGTILMAIIMIPLVLLKKPLKEDYDYKKGKIRAAIMGVLVCLSIAVNSFLPKILIGSAEGYLPTDVKRIAYELKDGTNKIMINSIVRKPDENGQISTQDTLELNFFGTNVEWDGKTVWKEMKDNDTVSAYIMSKEAIVRNGITLIPQMEFYLPNSEGGYVYVPQIDGRYIKWVRVADDDRDDVYTKAGDFEKCIKVTIFSGKEKEPSDKDKTIGEAYYFKGLGLVKLKIKDPQNGEEVVLELTQYQKRKD